MAAFQVSVAYFLGRCWGSDGAEVMEDLESKTDMSYSKVSIVFVMLK